MGGGGLLSFHSSCSQGRLVALSCWFFPPGLPEAELSLRSVHSWHPISIYHFQRKGSDTQTGGICLIRGTHSWRKTIVRRGGMGHVNLLALQVQPPHPSRKGRLYCGFLLPPQCGYLLMALQGRGWNVADLAFPSPFPLHSWQGWT